MPTALAEICETARKQKMNRDIARDNCNTQTKTIPTICDLFTGITTGGEELVEENSLSNIEAFEKASDILVRGLPWKAPRSDHRLTVHRLCLAAAHKQKSLKQK